MAYDWGWRRPSKCQPAVHLPDQSSEAGAGAGASPQPPSRHKASARLTLGMDSRAAGISTCRAEHSRRSRR